MATPLSRKGPATHRVVLCPSCGAKHAVDVKQAGNYRCGGCGTISRIRR